MLETYPFVPTRATDLAAGHYFAFPFGTPCQYAAGLVVEVGNLSHPLHNYQIRSEFVCVLLDWAGEQPPAQAEVETATATDAWGFIHVKAIDSLDGSVLGRRDLEKYPIGLPEKVTHRSGGTVWVVRGTERVRPATREETSTMQVLPTFGLTALRNSANNRFGDDHNAET